MTWISHLGLGQEEIEQINWEMSQVIFLKALCKQEIIRACSYLGGREGIRSDQRVKLDCELGQGLR